MKTDHQPIVIFGGTGHYGSKIVHHLLEKNEKVRVLSRNAQQAKLKLGKTIDIIEGDVTCRQVVDRTLTGGKAVVICLSAMNPKSIKRLERIERDGVLTIMEAAQKAGIRRLVYLSGYEIRAEVLEALNIFQFGAIKLEIEKKIRASAFNWTILGVAPSFDLFFAFLRHNKMAVPGGGTKPIPTISPEDVGEIAAQTVLNSNLNGRRYRLTGPEAISFPEAANRIATFTNTPIKHVTIPLVFVRIIFILTLPFNPFLRFIYWSLKLLNNFPEDLVQEVPADHKTLSNTFQYTPMTFDREVKRRFGS